MGLSCSCDDFDPSEHDCYFEHGRANVPPAGTKCCECNAPLPSEKQSCVLEYEVYEPEEPEPEQQPWGGWPEEMTEAEIAGKEAIRDAWETRNGYDIDTERCLKSSKWYRCDRCAGLAEAIEDLGYCMVIPGELIEDHLEFIDEHGHALRKWVPDAAGVLNPHPWTRTDHIMDWATRKYRVVRYWLRFGWKLDLQYKVIWRIRNKWNRIRRKVA